MGTTTGTSTNKRTSPAGADGPAGAAGAAGAATPAGAVGQAPTLFTRKATGLVREGRTRDALFYNVMWSSVALTFAFYWLFLGSYGGSNAILGILLAAAFGLPMAFLYAMFTQLMPRSGGDYVFNSRILHPAIGFAANFSFCLWVIVSSGIYTTYIADYGFGGFARTMAGFTGARGWLNFGHWFSTDWGLFLTGVAILLVSAGLFVAGGTHLFFRVQIWCFALYILGAIGVPVIVGLLQSQAGFVHNFNAYAANLGTPHASAALVASAAKAGYHPTKFSLEASVRSVSVFWFVYGFLFSSTYFAGEIRLQRGTHLRSMPGAVAVAVITMLLLAVTFTHFASYTFNGRLAVADPAAYGFLAGAPAYPEIVGIASGSAVWGILAIVGFTAGLFIWLPQTLMLVSRSMFAWSFDRVAPERLSSVEPRTRSPLLAVGIIMLLVIASTAVYSFTNWFTTLSVELGVSFTMVITAVAAIVLPFRHPELVASSPYARRVVGVPLFVLVGALALLGFLCAMSILLWDPASGVSLSKDPGKLPLAALVYLVGFGLYYAARAFRRRQGVELELAYRELPPE
ncbi:MAG TPA: amino acid permease [Solirubrobacteraceae bacterium]|nr:amino acid permease [Solirubrobacteraceae bacterium]